ncbi:DNL-type zinc finger protein-like [Prorops nasuta]|uniref:DNL-type zinc finger protein-like n=1 Tax=Prorops nasuta TaxID=863751 RepID=UPI0034CF3EB6
MSNNLQFDLFNYEKKETDNNDIAKHALGKAKRRLQISFTCKKCNTRNHKTFSKQAYEEGIVIIRCDGCKNNHLIADNLGWFTDYPREKVNIEYLLKLKGENVRKVLNDVEGYCEILKDESSANSQEPNEK